MNHILPYNWVDNPQIYLIIITDLIKSEKYDFSEDDKLTSD